MENTATLTTAARNKMAMMNGLLLGVIYVVLTTGVNLAVNNMMMYYLLKTLGYVAYIVLAGIFAKNIRKANGGYIEFREVFGAIFIMLLVAGTITYLYNHLYMYVIDPEFMNKIKASSLRMMEKAPNVTDEMLDDAAAKFDKQIADAKNIGKNFLYFLGGIMMDCLFGLIACAIVKKPRPIFE